MYYFGLLNSTVKLFGASDPDVVLLDTHFSLHLTTYTPSLSTFVLCLYVFMLKKVIILNAVMPWSLVHLFKYGSATVFCLS